MALYLIDTNILARRMDKGSPQYPIVRQALQTLKLRGEEAVIVPQTLYELWVVLTRPVSARGGFGYTPIEAARIQAGICRLCRVFPDSQAIFPEWQHLVSTYSVSGVSAHDARLVAAMKVHGISRILTFNGSDFNRYAPEGISPIDPINL